MTRRSDNNFYLAVGIYVAALGLLGFARNFYLLPLGSTPLADSGPIYPGVVLHGVLFTIWMGMAVWQPWQIRRGRVANHRRTGVWTAWLAVALFVTGIFVGGVQAVRMLGDGEGAGFFAVPLVLMLPLQGGGAYWRVSAFDRLGFVGVPTPPRRLRFPGRKL